MIEVGKVIEYSFNVIFATSLIQMEVPYPMKCTVNDTFSASSNSNLGNRIKETLNSTFEFSQEDIR